MRLKKKRRVVPKRLREKKEIPHELKEEAKKKPRGERHGHRWFPYSD